MATEPRHGPMNLGFALGFSLAAGRRNVAWLVLWRRGYRKCLCAWIDGDDLSNSNLVRDHVVPLALG